MSLGAIAQDILVKKDGESVECKVLKVDSLNVYVVFHWSGHEVKTSLDKNEVQEIKYGASLDNTNKDEIETTDSVIASKETTIYSVENGLKGKMDARLFHGRVVGNVISGFLFGAFGVIGAALSNPKPTHSIKTIRMSKNKDIFNNASYLKGYKKKARGMNVVNSAIGWTIWIALVVLVH